VQKRSRGLGFCAVFRLEEEQPTNKLNFLEQKVKEEPLLATKYSFSFCWF